MISRPILVTGATGKTGSRRLVAWLEARDHGSAVDDLCEIANALTEVIGRPILYIPTSFDQFHAELERSVGKLYADTVTDIARKHSMAVMHIFPMVSSAHLVVRHVTLPSLP